MTETKPYKLIDDINFLSVSKFEDCICDQKLSVLIIEGNPDPILLVECWSNLYAQYLDILGDAETIYVLQLEAEIEQLRFKIETAEGIVNVLKSFHVQQLVDALKWLEFDVKKLVYGSPHYEYGLNKITSRLAHYKLKLLEKQQELLQYTIDKNEDTVTRQKLLKQRMRLSKFQGYSIKPTKTMVPEYVAILKDFLEHSKIKQDGSEQER